MNGDKPDLSPSQLEVHQRRIEYRMMRFIEDTWAVLNSGRLTLAGVKETLRVIDESVKERGEFESMASAEFLSPFYFEMSAALDALRKHVAEAIVKIEADPECFRPDSQE
jgi:hypothetical protein